MSIARLDAHSSAEQYRSDAIGGTITDVRKQENAVTTDDVEENRELVETKNSWQAEGSPVGLMFVCSAVVSCSHIVSWFHRYWD